MREEEFQLLFHAELTANTTLNWILGRIFSEGATDAARAALIRIASQFPPDMPAALPALIYYRAMRNALKDLPAARDACDAAAFEMFRLLYHDQAHQPPPDAS